MKEAHLAQVCCSARVPFSAQNRLQKLDLTPPFPGLKSLTLGNCIAKGKSGCFGFSGYKEHVLWGWITGFRYCLQ